MYKRDSQDWVKHWDFMVIDLIALQIAFVISYILQTGSVNPYQVPEYRNTAMIVVLLHVCAEFLMEGYSSVLIRGYWKEFIAVFQQACVVFACFLVYLFIVKDTWVLSRTFMLLYFAMAVCFLYCGRVLLKVWLKSHKGITTGKRTILLVGNRDNYRELIDAFLKNPYSEFRVVGALVKDLQDEEQQKADTAAAAYRGIPLFSDEEKTLAFILANWVDEVMIQMPRDYLVAEGTEFINICSRMGVIIHLDLSKVIGDMRYQVVEKIEDYHVLSKSMCMVTTRQLIAKRALDILGGITGCLITGILFLVIGPVIYIKSPGPILFRQERVGRNGKKFRIYKFRSMYMDAEERKKELLTQNTIEDGMMFKVDDDPRIIRGIGTLIRKLSIDEFPQFWNVLKGDMSLVGTRPPTVDEWEKYNFEHRGRLAIKPGITGLWQVSGRSEIKDFDEVVRLDKRYIEEWSLGMDFRILLKTILVVLHRDGAQ